jgi:DNA-directed RNA polymerase specialized sigma24 family protein
VIRFLSLFLTDKDERKRLYARSLTPKDSEHLYKLATAVYMNMWTVSVEDIEHDLYLIILDMAKRYKNVGKGFISYIASSFHYEAFRCVWKYLATAALSYDNLDQNDDLLGAVIFSDKEGHETSVEALNGTVNTVEWVSGLFADAPFDNLSPQERLLVVRRFVEKHTLKQIAEEMGYSASGIAKKLAAVKHKLCIALKESE